MTSRQRLGYGLLLPALAILGVFLVYPIVGALFHSLHVYPVGGGREYVGLGNYAEFLRDQDARETVGFTLLFVLVSVTLEILCGIGIALVIHQAFRGRGLVRAAVLVPWAIPTVVTAVMWKYMFNDQYGFVNLVLYGGRIEDYRAYLADPATARLAIIVADVWKTSSFAALLVLAGLQTIPEELYEAARIDGAGALRRFFSVTLPLLRPAILVAVLFRTMDAFRVFDLVFVMTGGGPANSTSVLQWYGYQALFPEGRLGYGSAISVIVFGIIGLFSLVTIRLVGVRALRR